MTVEIITRRLCGGCQELKRRLSRAGVSFIERDTETIDGLAAWAWRDAPNPLPAAVIDGRLLPNAGDATALNEAIERSDSAKSDRHGPDPESQSMDSGRPESHGCNRESHGRDINRRIKRLRYGGNNQ